MKEVGIRCRDCTTLDFSLSVFTPYGLRTLSFSPRTHRMHVDNCCDLRGAGLFTS